MPIDRTTVAAAFEARFGQPPPLVVRAPGRVNLIGEHTDYNDGFVLPLALDRAVWIALRPRADRTVDVASLDFDQRRQFALDGLTNEGAGWVEYLKGVAWSLTEAGHRLAGWEGVVAGDVPLGAGLSSSAALEMAAARAFAAAGNVTWDAKAAALLCQRAENRWVGVQCGIMDQLISAVGRDDHAVLIDCRDLELDAVPLPGGLAVVVLDTGTRRGLVDSAYNQRRAQCEAAAGQFRVKALRDIDVATLESRRAELDDETFRRARHVISENARTVDAAAAMRRGDAAELGRLMDASHVSLRDDFQVSSPALDAMVEVARRQSACLGARMTGAGFGGCAVAIVAAATAAEFAATTAEQYRAATGHQPAVYVCRATSGAAVV